MRVPILVGELTAMDVLAAEQAASRLHRARQFFVHSSLIAVVSVLIAAALSARFPSALVPLSIATGVEGLVALCAFYVYRDLVQKLALDPAGQQIPAVLSYCDRLTCQSERNRLAGSIQSLIADSRLPGAFPLADRVRNVEAELRTVARALVRPEVKIQPRSLVLCIRLLSSGVESPLFNARLPEEQLRATLLRIRLGIGR